ncbi:MAG TPA: AAA family ATPase [Burkholderiaceae bacterium]|jgi:general secretion pathway protein A
MYTKFFRLNQAPFSIAPDPRYLYMSDSHREALAHLLYGVNIGGGFVLLTGEIGTGKTTVCRCFLEQIPENCDVAYIFNPKLTVHELLQTICEEFRIEFGHDAGFQPTAKHYVDALNDFLLTSHAQGKNSVLVIDEAQNLSEEVLEQLRLLTNLETNERKLLQIILIGQPELRDMLTDPRLEQLAQRVIAHFHLGPLSDKETARYIIHRLSIAGLSSSPPFSRRSVQQIYERTNGVPRRINLLCDRALLGAYTENKTKVNSDIVDKASGEMFDKPVKSKAVKAHARRNVALAFGSLVGVTVTITIAITLSKGVLFKDPRSVPPPRSAPAAIVNPPAAQAAPIQVAAVERSATLAALPSKSVPALTLAELNGATNASMRDERLAFKNLAKYWKVTLPDGEPCQAAQENNLHCYQSDGGLDEIRQMDRPVILTLHDDGNNRYFVLLTGLSNASATLQIGGMTRTISMIELSRHFRGHLATFWQAPKNFREKIRSGLQGDDVNWLAAQMAKLNGQPEPTEHHSYNKALYGQVHAFQLAHGLPADGIVGPKTYMHINAEIGINEPRLQDNTISLNASSKE